MPAPGPCEEEAKCKPEKVAGHQGAQGMVQQATGVAREVLLVPRTVYVPYVQQTPVGVARVVTSQGGLAVSQTTSSVEAAAGAQGVTPEAETQAATAEEVQRLRQQLQECQAILKRLQDSGAPCCPPK
jgi:hypothetical protein